MAELKVHAQFKRGRPTGYTAEIATTICRRLIDGESLRSICDGAGMPDKATVFRWIACHNEFRVQYGWACELRQDQLLHEILKIADGCTPDNESIKCARLRINTRMRQLGRMAPRKYGRS